MEEITKEVCITVDGITFYTFINLEDFERIIDSIDSEWAEDNIAERWFVDWVENVRKRFQKS